ncbi:MAG: porin [Bacteroidota bacterium]
MKWTTIAFCFIPWTYAITQTTFSSGNHVLEMTGIINTYLSYFDRNAEEDQFGFELRDVRFLLSGEHYPAFKYQIMVDFADLGSSDSLENFLQDAYVNIDLPSKFDLFVGFQRMPFGRNSNVSTFSSVFHERPFISGGSLYYRRNLGLVVRKKFMDDLINLHVGLFNGGNSLRLRDSKSNTMSFVFRTDLSFPTKILYEEVDVRLTPVPLFSIGLNTMFTQHEREVEQNFFPIEIDGQKWISAIDLAFFFQGFSFQLEATQSWANRNNSATQDLADAFESYGLHFSTNYFFKNINSLLSFRYEIFNPDNSRYDHDFQSISVGFNFLVNQSHDQVFRAEYRHFFEDNNDTTFSNSREVHLGFQFRF